ncbi:MAG: Minus agglutinin [Candidatus Amesbacteria bacterium GW2011_GWA1_47_16]|uniref:Minus agglutinin n=2 Tax=Candidatus Amesiibacteriota TaxID=1752730 RepID=A0A0G1U8P8_9BACT|nr:MAG: Minus agglutinin [Candidatus Amesbacteria bacterium GW2011_GWC1_47_15]KKU64693.1 MAG: Minus agglutinin [Candidatus Amesbacteria bacterium GW2011_GWA1_47_16]
MEQHPVPQNISSYEFRLVGDMTLKQFIQLAAGIVLGVGVFRLPIPGIIKYPTIFVLVILGIAMAFVPINNRPFTAWFTAFIKAIYSPTEFTWQPQGVEAVSPEISPVSPGISSAPAVPAPIRLGFTDTFKSMFVRRLPPAPEVIPVPEPAPSLPPVAPPASSIAQQTETPAFIVSKEISQESPVKDEAALAASSSPAAAPVVAPEKPAEEPAKPVFTMPASPVSPDEVSAKSGPAISPVSYAPPSTLPPAAPPAPSLDAPSIPDILLGQALDSSGQPLPGVTIEIVDAATGIPARALRTNRLGQFQIAIPLPKGSYIIQAEKESLLFDPVTIEAKGVIIPPINLSAKTAT